MLQLPLLNFHFVATTVILLFLVAPESCNSWDFAVANENVLQLMSIDGKHEIVSKVELNNGTNTDYRALAYDPSAERFFFSEDDGNFSLYEHNARTNRTRHLVTRGKYPIQGIAFDVSTQIIYWSDGYGGSISEMSLNEEPLEPKVLIRLSDQVVQGITVSYCHRGLFWANSNHTSASIHRAELDGTRIKALVTHDIFQPQAVAVDERSGKIYWTDGGDGIYYRIERCDLDGNDRELILRRKHQTPFSIILYALTLIWSDLETGKIYSLSADMTFPNHTKAQLEPSVIYEFEVGTRPTGVVAYRNVSISCEPEPMETYMHRDNHMTDAVVTETVPEYCLNGGHVHKSSCVCKRGFRGKYCEIPVCMQYCLHGGSCFTNHQGYTECSCLPGYEGPRCERDLCDDFCLSGGRCYIESGQPTCSCPSPTTGQRCEVSMAVLTSPTSSNDFAIIAALAAISCLLLVIVLILAWKVLVLRRRPRVKKRYIVNKAYRVQGNSQTQMTSRPPNSPAVEQCEITIENCCNMNVCETPCFEPNLRSSKSNSKKSEDKRNLLHNMEEPAGSD